MLQKEQAKTGNAEQKVNLSEKEKTRIRDMYYNSKIGRAHV